MKYAVLQEVLILKVGICKFRMKVYSFLSTREITSLIPVRSQSILARMTALIQHFLLINVSEFISALQDRDLMIVLWYVSMYLVEQKSSSDPS
jgi:hypothetical protein